MSRSYIWLAKSLLVSCMGLIERYNILSEENKLVALNRQRIYLETREEKRKVVLFGGVTSSPHSDKDSNT